MSIQSIYHSMSSTISDYASYIPENTAKAACISGAFNFAVGFLILNNEKASSLRGAMAITATLIHGAISPLFQKFGNNRQELNFVGEALRTSISYAGSFALAASLGYRFPLTTMSLVVAANLFPKLFASSRTDYAHSLFV
ncbi:Uncharacterized protein PRO82_001874 [Candidatus Protochlamydia amoebophila]|uniref:hypothetical protein n=1 Tax=Candidatus Protochlamydia amoebophila TaxID=362787 RepID=UPI001BC92961|nr:hypothetical protein [Candidatus Protochlamydia amoebophila]MBS4164544.1 Uncharacterized protein [Candidatus Protochlamydia amoebophila]